MTTLTLDHPGARSGAVHWGTDFNCIFDDISKDVLEMLAVTAFPEGETRLDVTNLDTDCPPGCGCGFSVDTTKRRWTLVYRQCRREI